MKTVGSKRVIPVIFLNLVLYIIGFCLVTPIMNGVLILVSHSSMWFRCLVVVVNGLTAGRSCLHPLHFHLSSTALAVNIVRYIPQYC